MSKSSGTVNAPRMKPRRFGAAGRIDRDDLDQRLARPGDDEGLALRGGVDEPRELRLGFVDIDGSH
jgi:hypothetical protein